MMISLSMLAEYDFASIITVDVCSGALNCAKISIWWVAPDFPVNLTLWVTRYPLFLNNSASFNSKPVPFSSADNSCTMKICTYENYPKQLRN